MNKRGLELCAECPEYPCGRFEPEKRGCDSFVTHRKVFSNLDFIKSSGIASFIAQQKIRMETLTAFLTQYDDGRSKSFFCIGCALLPLEELIEARRLADGFGDSIDNKEKNRRLKEKLSQTADRLGIELKLNKKVTASSTK